MLKNPRRHISSLMTVVLVLILTIVLESRISFMFDVLSPQKPDVPRFLWLGLRIGSVIAVMLLWRMNQKKFLFRGIVLADGLLTLGLMVSTVSLISMLANNNHIPGLKLLADVVFLAFVNVLAFSIWYWLIDPPGIDEEQPNTLAWEFLFPQRAEQIPGYEKWIPRYTDYLALAFYTSVAFSPTDALPLTRRAKVLMIIQAAVSLISITVIAGSAINILT